jgi:hypothetical protein
LRPRYIDPGNVNRILPLLSILIAVGLAACNDGDKTLSIPSQHWKENVVRLETHPNPPLPGMSEIVVIITGPHGKPTGDLIVSLRASESDPWVQAIQDGFIGVYRRAVDIGEGESAVVQVRLQQGSEQQVLRFPLKLAAG